MKVNGTFRARSCTGKREREREREREGGREGGREGALFASHGLPSSGAGWVDSNRHYSISLFI